MHEAHLEFASQSGRRKAKARMETRPLKLADRSRLTTPVSPRCGSEVLREERSVVLV